MTGWIYLSPSGVWIKPVDGHTILSVEPTSPDPFVAQYQAWIRYSDFDDKLHGIFDADFAAMERLENGDL